MSLGIIDWGEEPKTLPDPRMEWLVTANLAVPPSVMADLGGFETRLGRVGDKLVGGEDTFFQKELMRRGFPCFYYPDMKVTHHVPASRLKKRWFLRRYYSEGICKALMKRIEDRPYVARRMSMALSSAFKLLMSPVDMLSILLPAGTPRSFAYTRFSPRLYAFPHCNTPATRPIYFKSAASRWICTVMSNC